MSLVGSHFLIFCSYPVFFPKLTHTYQTDRIEVLLHLLILSLFYKFVIFIRNDLINAFAD